MNSVVATEINTKSHLKNATEEGTEDKPKSVKRLRFKSSLSDKIGDVSRQQKAKGRSEVASENLQSKVYPEIRKESIDCKPTRRPLKVLEYGSDASGYKFIAFDEKEIPGPKHNFTDTNESEDHNDDSSLSGDEGGSIASSGPDEKPSAPTYRYGDYLDLWEGIEAGVERESFPLPVKSNSMNDLSKANVLNFLKKKAVIRQERIRWHPDRMRTILCRCQMWNSGVEKDVTHVFQIVNDTYETV